jgi:hypothetical protein
VCNESFKRHPPRIIGADHRVGADTPSWDRRAHIEAGRLEYD